MERSLLINFMQRFFGYGSWQAKLWFVGLEEGGGNSSDEVNRRLDAWDRSDDLADLREFHATIGGATWFADHPRIQPTWGKLIRVALAADGKPVDKELVREFQRDFFGSTDGELALIELFPLPSPSTSDWNYESFEIPEIATRETYREGLRAKRVAAIRDRIAQHLPFAVIFYGFACRAEWTEIAGVSFEPVAGERFMTASNGTTRFVMAPHPTARGVRNSDFEAIGKWLRNDDIWLRRSEGIVATADDIVRCRFPFPALDPPIRMPEGCMRRCPRADAIAFAKHHRISPDDRELLAAIHDFATWFYGPDQANEMFEEQIRHAALLYTRSDHSGTCIPKTILFMHYKHLQYYTDGENLELSDTARRALKGDDVASWPDGDRASGPPWNEMFNDYSRRYE